MAGFIKTLNLLWPIAFALFFETDAIAQSSCDTANRYTFDWDSAAIGTIDENATHDYIVTNAASGATDSVTLSISFGGDLADLGDVDFGGTTGIITTPYIGIINTGGIGATEKTQTLGAVFDAYSSKINSNVDAVSVLITFSKPVREVDFTVLDADQSDFQFTD